MPRASTGEIDVERVAVGTAQRSGPRYRMNCGRLNPCAGVDVLRYSKGSKPLGIEPGEYARVSHVDRESNTLTVKRHGGEELSYDPRRLQGLASGVRQAVRD
jgi:hypothetical protein